MLKKINIENLLENGLIDYWLFIFIFFSRLFTLLILGMLLGVSETYQHEILLLEKYSYFAVIGYLGVKYLYYFVKYRRVPLEKCHIYTILFCAVALISTIINDGNALRYDYFTKLSLLELFMTVVFMFQIGKSIDEKQFQKSIYVCGKAYIFLTLAFNVISLISACLAPHGGIIHILGLEKKLPTFFYDPNPWRLFSYRYAGLYGSTTTLGNHCYLAVWFAIYFKSKKKIHPALFWSVFLSNVVMIVLSSNRTGLIMLFLIAMFAVSKKLQNDKSYSFSQSIWVMIAAIGCLFLALCVLKMDTVKTVITALIEDPFTAIDRFSSARLRVAVSAINMVKQNPVIGVGWNKTFDIIKKTTGKVSSFTTAHNSILTILGWTGLAGALVSLLFTIEVFKAKKKNWDYILSEQWLLCLVVCVFVQSMIEQALIGDSRHAFTYLFWLVLGRLIVKKDAVSDVTTRAS